MRVDVYAVTVTGKLSESLGKVTLNRKTGRYEQRVQVKNQGQEAVPGTLSLVLDQLPAGVYLAVVNGYTSVHMAPAGSPYVNLNIGADNVLTPGETSQAFVLEFVGPGASGVERKHGRNTDDTTVNASEPPR